MTQAVLIGEGYKAGAETHPLVLNGFRPVALPGNRIALRFRQLYILTEETQAPPRERWRVQVVGYMYHLVEPATENEILAFHWHPDLPEEGESIGATQPHLHIGSRQLRGEWLSRRQHIPSGAIAVQP